MRRVGWWSLRSKVMIERVGTLESRCTRQDVQKLRYVVPSAPVQLGREVANAQLTAAIRSL